MSTNPPPLDTLLEGILLELGTARGFFDRRDADGNVLCCRDGCNQHVDYPRQCLCDWHASVAHQQQRETQVEKAFRLRVDKLHEALIRAGKKLTRAEAETLVRNQIHEENRLAAATQDASRAAAAAAQKVLLP